MTGIIDYGAGNLRSVANAVHALGIEPRLVSKASDLEGVSHLILPGVGAFGDCMAELSKRDLIEPVRDWAKAGKPYFGICLGYQILFEGSEEAGGTEGLGVFPGSVRRFREDGRKIPHMGWNAALPVKPEDELWEGLGEFPYFYFVHSYFPEPADPAIVAMRTEYGETFASAIRSGAVVGTQFHPEKSQQAGLRLLGNFLGAVPAAV
ncbi:imidazole glycerol phosphate synthase subunit HisH [Luteolibacter sp. GHJ8]|uniref:Imidazole glycerol phosphate synthase subunit HisH n=1 Tax=Luteolibacter rhizosphaerae TaxID=2989719 RepID=A0ABT3G961_9BACT|nr:imidazole glycerol phosphate synthase subunit HisH [Luteolibacter rhizosphaerae]MCW1916393.1 imidazole glycerol phosphate synthase subunit HisH [Luteolibacter rhizosphaerae]